VAWPGRHVQHWPDHGTSACDLPRESVVRRCCVVVEVGVGLVAGLTGVVVERDVAVVRPRYRIDLNWRLGGAGVRLGVAVGRRAVVHRAVGAGAGADGVGGVGRAGIGVLVAGLPEGVVVV
jgi:hypothetical protein